jgi:hypothetical protein
MSIRAIIGSVAVLSGLVVLEQSVDASTGQAGSCKSTQAYALMQPDERIGVRAQPTPEAAVVGTIASPVGGGDLTASVVTLNSSQSGWARIVLASTRDFTARGGDGGGKHFIFGWIPADLLTVDSRVDGPITTYTRPGLLGHATGQISGEDIKFRVLGCRGEWLQVINESRGNTWIDRWCAKAEGCRG